MKKKVLLILSISLSIVSAKATTIYVNLNATGINDGTSWTNAYVNLQDAIDAATASDDIWVAQGTYHPTKDILGNSSPADMRELTFGLNTTDRNIFGGFNGTETLLSQRDWVNNVTILSGNIGDPSLPTDNCYAVFHAFNSSFVLDGFTIADGYAIGLNGTSYLKTKGAGVYYRSNTNQSATIRNCVIKNNIARSESGLFVWGEDNQIDIRVENTRFTENVGRWAPPFNIFAAGGTINPIFVNCLIDNNSVDEINSQSGQTAPGGRFQTYTQPSSVINGKVINCTFTKNETINSSIIDTLSAVLAIQQYTGTTNMMSIYNCIFYDNNDNVNNTYTSIGYTNVNYKPDTVTVYKTFSEDVIGSLNTYIGTVNNIQGNPLFTNSTSNDFTLQSNSAAIGFGDTTGISNLIPTTDLEGNNRYNSTIDLGCYEYHSGVGITEQTQQNYLSVYPNPASGYLTINTNNLQVKNVEIYDVSGKRVESIALTTNSIDVSSLIDGVYFIRVLTEKGVLSTKFIKN